MEEHGWNKWAWVPTSFTLLSTYSRRSLGKTCYLPHKALEKFRNWKYWLSGCNWNQKNWLKGFYRKQLNFPIPFLRLSSSSETRKVNFVKTYQRGYSLRAKSQNETEVGRVSKGLLKSKSCWASHARQDLRPWEIFFIF